VVGRQLHPRSIPLLCQPTNHHRLRVADLQLQYSPNRPHQNQLPPKLPTVDALLVQRQSGTHLSLTLQAHTHAANASVICKQLKEGQSLSMIRANKLEKTFQQNSVGQYAIRCFAMHLGLSLRILTLQNWSGVTNSMWMERLILLNGTMILVMGVTLAFATGEMEKWHITQSLLAMLLFQMEFCVLRRRKNLDLVCLILLQGWLLVAFTHSSMGGFSFVPA